MLCAEAAKDAVNCTSESFFFKLIATLQGNSRVPRLVVILLNLMMCLIFFFSMNSSETDLLQR